VMFDIDSIYAVGIRVVLFVAEFVAYKKKDQDKTRHSQRKTGDVDKRIPLLPLEMTQGDFQIIFKHGITPIK
jgi:hypothetical protein